MCATKKGSVMSHLNRLLANAEKAIRSGQVYSAFHFLDAAERYAAVRSDVSARKFSAIQCARLNALAAIRRHRSKQDKRRAAGSLAIFVALILGIGAGIVAIASADTVQRWERDNGYPYGKLCEVFRNCK